MTAPPPIPSTSMAANSTTCRGDIKVPVLPRRPTLARQGNLAPTTCSTSTPPRWNDPQCPPHLVIRNAAGKTMIAEIPSPRCVSRKSLWRSQIRAARRTFMARDHATTSWKQVHQRITLRGLGFFDEIHDVTGQAPNGIELKPVTRVRF
jgi:hypothetical protein